MSIDASPSPGRPEALGHLHSASGNRSSLVRLRAAAMRYPGEKRFLAHAEKVWDDISPAEITNAEIACAAAAIFGDPKSSTAVREFWGKSNGFSDGALVRDSVSQRK
jgi:hypothetical protein